MGTTDNICSDGYVQAGTLEAVGLTDLEERAYVLLLEHPGATVPEVADVLGVSDPVTESVLKILEAKGLLSRSPEPHPRHLPVPPDLAVEALAAKKQEELQRARLVVPLLLRMANAADDGRGAEPLVAAVTDGDAVSLHYRQMRCAAQSKLIELVNSSPTPGAGPGATKAGGAQTRALIERRVYDHSILHLHGGLEGLRNGASAGEEVRIVRDVPFSLVVVDSRVAMMPLNLDDPDAGALLIRSPALVGVFEAFFESVWNRAAPVSVARPGELQAADAAGFSTQDADRMIPLLTAGLKDEAIARQMGLSLRTLDRRIHSLMLGLGAQTRFQAGWLARAAFDGSSRNATGDRRNRLRDRAAG